MENNKNIFLNPKTNIRDIAYIGFFFILVFILIFNFLSSSSFKSYGNIYLPIAIISMVLLAIAIATKQRTFSEVIYGNIKSNKDLFISIGIGLLVGGILVLTSQTFSILPFSLSTQNYNLIESFSLLLVVGFIGVEMEEMAFASTFFPTFEKFFKSGSEIPIIFVVSAILFLFMFGTQGMLFSFVFFALTILYVFSQGFRNLIGGKQYKKTFINMLLIAIVFGLFHIYSYGSSPDLLMLMGSAMLFRFVVDGINYFRRDAISSRIVHSINNSSVASYAMNISIILAIIVVGTYISVIYIIYKFGKTGTAKNYASISGI